MKFEFSENQYYTWVNLIPETPKEAAQLLRFTKSSKKEIPTISFRFSGEELSCGIEVKKVQASNQNNYLRNK